MGIYVQQTNIAMSHGINLNSEHIRSRETYTSTITNGKKSQSDENDAYNNHNRFRPSHDNQVNKFMHPIAEQDNKSTTIITHLAGQTYVWHGCKWDFAGLQIYLQPAKIKSQHFGVSLKFLVCN